MDRSILPSFLSMREQMSLSKTMTRGCQLHTLGKKKNVEMVQYFVQCMTEGSRRLAVQPVSSPDENVDFLIWIDFICINQENLEERNLQVSMMDRIYGKARYVLVWLGRDDGTIAMANETISKILSVRDSFATSNIVPYKAYTPEEFKREGVPYISGEGWDALAALFSRQWFRRIWIIQEVIFGSYIIMFCGNQEVFFDEIALACEVINGWYAKHGYVSSNSYIPLDEVATSVEYYVHNLDMIRRDWMTVAKDRTSADGKPVGE